MRIDPPQSRSADRRSASDRAGRSALAQRVGRPALAAALVAFALFVGAAAADTGTKIIERCTHGQGLGGFSQQDYRRALQELPTEVEEYSDCANLIRRAQLAAAGGSGGSSAGGTPTAIATPLSPSERTALGSVPKTGSAPQSVGGQIVHPGVVHANIASAFSTLPDPLLAMLAFLLACALLLAGRALRNGVRAHRAR